jgi:transcriptional regulator with XRE-family HTH domain
MQRGALPHEPRPTPPVPQRHGRVAFLMPGVTASLRATKPELAVEQGDTLGAQLRKRRRELGLHRRDAAALLGADEKSLMWWERNEREPLERFWPGVIQYLGREPWPSPTSLGGNLLAERRRRGLTQVEAAALIGVDDGTYRFWEGGRRTPYHARTQSLLAAFIDVQPD